MNTKKTILLQKIVLKKDWKTTLHPLHSQATEAEYSSSLSLPRFFSHRIVFLCFYHWLVCVLHLYLYLIFTENFYPQYNSKQHKECLQQYSSRSMCRTSIYDQQFRVMSEVHTNGDQKEVVIYVWSHNLPFISHIQL